MRHNCKHKKNTYPRLAIGFRISALLVFLFFLTIPAHSQDRRTPIVKAIEKAGPAVVNIRTEQVIKRRSSPFFGFSDPFFDDFFRDFFTPQQSYKTQSLGSGVIIDSRGYILTNAHVIEKASKIFVALPDSKKELEAELIGKEERIDLAVLKISEDKGLPHITLFRADDLMVGETVIAIGNPLGLGHSVTTGVVSAPRRRIPVGDNSFSVFIQTDALINPGNSGGPLLNINGELIGINTAIAKQAQGIGFAIPIDNVKRVLDDLIKYGKVRRAYLGIIPGSVGKIFNNEMGNQGVLIKEVEPKSPAASAGIRYGDVILEMDNTPVATPAEFRSLLATYSPGNMLNLKLFRGFKTQVVTVNLSEIPKDYALKYAKNLLGFTVKNSRSGLAVQKVTDGSAADKVGIKPGDIVAEVEGKTIEKLEDYKQVISDLVGQEPIRFLILRGNRGYYIDLP